MAGINRNGAPSTAPQGQSEGRNGKGQGLLGMSRYSQSGTWEPTVVYLLILVFLEIAAYGFFRATFKGVHGG